jgi:hypothetical protein
MASTYLSRTPGSSGNRKTWTFSTWVKRGNISIGNPMNLFGGEDGASTYSDIMIGTPSGADDTFWFKQETGVVAELRSTMKLRDPSGWYHLVFVYDSTNATADDRMKMYVNGVQLTDFVTRTNVGLNVDSYVNSNGDVNYVGSYQASSKFFEGEMAHVHLIDGTAYDASAFGETDATTGIWKPKTAPSVTYGTNGFFLKFENSGAFGTDSSGNSNTFTVNGTMTQTIDTPSNVFATLNPLGVTGGTSFANLSNGNLTYTGNASTYGYVASTLGVSSGKYYFEAKLTQKPNTNTEIGIADLPSTTNTQILGRSDPNSISFSGNGSVYQNNSALSWTGSTYVLNDIVGIALDLDNNRLFFSINGTWQNSADPTTSTGAISITAPENLGTTGAYFFAVGDQIGYDTAIWQCNFGNGYFGTTAVSSAQNPDDGIGIFEYSVPTGYKALCTKSINAEEYS